MIGKTRIFLAFVILLALLVPAHALYTGSEDLGSFDEGTEFRVKLNSSNDYAYLYVDGSNVITDNCATNAKYQGDIDEFDDCPAICVMWDNPDEFCDIHSRSYSFEPSTGQHSITIYVLDRHGYGCNIDSEIQKKEPGESTFTTIGTFEGDQDGGSGLTDLQACKGDSDYWESAGTSGLTALDRKTFNFTVNEPCNCAPNQSGQCNPAHNGTKCNGCHYVPAPSEGDECDWKDNDCDGLVDEDSSGNEYGLCGACEKRYMLIENTQDKNWHANNCAQYRDGELSRISGSFEHSAFIRFLDSTSAPTNKEIFIDPDKQTFESFCDDVPQDENCWIDYVAPALDNSGNALVVAEETRLIQNRSSEEAFYGLCENTNQSIIDSLESAEDCNGLDDDCDGFIDEDFECIQGSESCTDDCRLEIADEPPTVAFDGTFSGYISESIEVSGTCEDSDGTIDSCTIQIQDNDCTSSTSSSGTGTGSAAASMTISCSLPGRKTAEIVGVDSGGNVVSDETEINVIGNFDSSVLVENTPPTKPDILLESNSRNAGATLTCTASSQDPDVGFSGGQTLEYTYKFYKNGNLIEGTNEESSQYATSSTGGEGTYTCTSTVCDSIECVESDSSLELEICSIYETWDGEKCVSNAIRDNNTFLCDSKPPHSIWDDVASYTQEFDGTSWVPAPSQTAYSGTSEKDSNTACFFVCEEGFDWNGTNCVPGPDEIRSVDCEEPETDNYVWTPNNNGKYTQWLKGGDWVPASSTIATGYALNEDDAGEPCKYLCETGYTWNGEGCVAELDYCGLVGLDVEVAGQQIGDGNVALTFSISCSDPDAIPGKGTAIDKVVFRDDEGKKVNVEQINHECSSDPALIKRSMDTNSPGNFSAEFFYGPEDLGCSREIFFSSTEEFGAKDRDLNVPGNNFLLAIAVLVSASIIILKKRE